MRRKQWGSTSSLPGRWRRQSRQWGRYPDAYPEVEPRIRRILLRRFPYGLYYAVEADRVVVHACYDLRREPSGWRSRG